MPARIERLFESAAGSRTRLHIRSRLRWLCLCLAALSLISGTGRAQAPAGASVHQVRPGEPATLSVWNRPIVTLRARVDEEEPATRVAHAERRFRELPPEALRGEVAIVPGKLDGLAGFFLTIDSHVIVGLLPADVDPESGRTLEQYAGDAASAAQQVLRAKREHQNIATLLRGIGRTLAATAVFALLLWAAVHGRRAALARIQGRLAKRKWNVLGVDVAQYFLAGQRLFTRLTAVALVLTAAYLWLTYVFVQFPYTEPWGERLGGFLRQQLEMLGSAAVGAVPNLFTVLLVLVVARMASRFVSTFFHRVEDGHVKLTWLEPESAKATRRIALALLWLFAIVVAYPYIPGSSSDAFKGVSVLAGLMITLGSSGLVNHMMSGLVLVYSRSFSPGDFVRIGDVEGTVVTMGVLSTKLVTQKREEVTIPNAVVVGDQVTNYTHLARGPGLIVSTTVTIGYDTPWRQVHAMLLLAAEQTAAVRKDPAPFVLQRGLSDFYVEYELRVHLDRPEDRLALLTELHAHIQDAFNESGVQIMSPHFVMQPPSKVYVPRDRWSEPPVRGEGRGIGPSPPTR